jgi:uncharacterized membrane protein YbhN (UPF0104 family)
MADWAGYLLTTEAEPRVRRARDLVRVLGGMLLVLLMAANTVRTGRLQESMFDFAEALPGWMRIAFWAGYGLGAVYAIALALVLMVRVRRNPGAARDLIVAVVGAFAIAILAMRWVEGVWPPLLPELGLEAPVRLFPIVRVAIMTAAVVIVSPHVTRPVRRFGSAMVLLVAISGFGLGFGLPSDAVAGIGIGMIAAGGVLLLFGSPGGFPDVGAVAAALHQLGVGVHGLEPAADQSWGTRRLVGVGDDGVTIEIKAFGRDAADTQVGARIWRSLLYRDAGPAPAFTRMQAVEHEALMALFAARAGVSAAEPLTAGLAGDDVAILAVRLPGRSLSGVSPDENGDDRLAAIWRDVAALHDADIAHGALNTSALMLTDEGHLFDRFEWATLAAGDRKLSDIVELLFSTSVQLGPERSVAVAHRALGTDRLAAALPYFQLPAVSRATRRTVAKPKAFMADLKREVADATGVEPPEPIKLRRVSLRSLLMSGLMLLAANALITQLGGIDYAAVWEVAKGASIVGLMVAFVFAHLTFVAEARSMLAAVGRPLPMEPLVVLQVGTKFMGLAVPSPAGRVMMMSAFLVKFGLGPTLAITQGAIDGAAGFVVEVFVLLLALAFSDRSFDLGGSTDWQQILLIVVGVVVVGVLLVLLIGRLRRLVLPIVKDALGMVASVAREPKRAVALLGSNFLSRLSLGVTLWILLRSVGVGDVTIAVAFAVTVATNLLAGLVPIPGGIGVAEAVMTSWLVLVGVPEAPAFAVTVLFRMFTFYIPAVEGFFAVRWLEKGGYL